MRPCSTSRPSYSPWNCGSLSIKLERWPGRSTPKTCSTGSSAGSASASDLAPARGSGGPMLTFLLLTLAADPTRADATGHQNYVEHVPDTELSFPMVAVRGGTFRQGSPITEPGRRDNEG